MTPQSLTLYLAASIGLALAPGPDILTVITRSITQGAWAGIVATLGFATGLIVHTTIAATGLSIILHESPAAFRTIQYLETAYLLFLAVRMFLGSDALIAPAGAAGKHLLRRIYGQSILMNVLNPKVTLFFVAYLSKFVERDGALPLWLQMVVLGTLFALCTILCFGLCAVFAGRLAGQLRRHPHAGRPLRWAAAVVFLLIAVLLVLD